MRVIAGRRAECSSTRQHRGARRRNTTGDARSPWGALVLGMHRTLALAGGVMKPFEVEALLSWADTCGRSLR